MSKKQAVPSFDDTLPLDGPSFDETMPLEAETPAPSDGGSALDKIAAEGAKMFKGIGPALGGAIGTTTGLGMVGELAGRAIGANKKEALDAAPGAMGLLGGVTGGPVGAGILAGGAEGLKQVNQMAMGDRPLPKSLEDIYAIGRDMKSTADSAATGELLGLGLAKGAKAIAGPATRRALGFTKGQLNSTKSFRETLRLQSRVNKSAEAIADNDLLAIRPTKTIENITKMFDSAGDEMNQVRTVLDKSGVKVARPYIEEEIIKSVPNEYPGQKAAVEKVMGDVGVLGEEISVSKLHELKTRLAKLGYGQATVDTDLAEVYRKAADTVDNILENVILEKGGEVAATKFTQAKKLYGDGMFAMKGLTQQVSAQMGNNLFDLPTYVLASGALGDGGIIKAAATAAGTKLARNYGSAAIAKGAKAVSKLPRGTGAGLAAILQRTREQK